MLLLLARHGETHGNREKRFQGHLDSPLNSLGEKQACRLSKAVNNFSPQAVYASDLDRARKTALLAAGFLKVPFYNHPLFREYAVGVLEGLTREETASLYPCLTQKMQEDILVLPPGAESFACFTRRLKWSRDFFAHIPQKCCLLVGHGRFINAFLTLLVTGRESPPYPFPVGHASLSAVDLRVNKATLLFHNDTCHLEKNL